MALSIPTIHVNGTSKRDLIHPLLAARESLEVALMKVAEACPNGRDYHLQGAGATQEALRQHNNRLHNIKAAYDELGEIAEAIA